MLSCCWSRAGVRTEHRLRLVSTAATRVERSWPARRRCAGRAGTSLGNGFGGTDGNCTNRAQAITGSGAGLSVRSRDWGSCLLVASADGQVATGLSSSPERTSVKGLQRSFAPFAHPAVSGRVRAIRSTNSFFSTRCDPALVGERSAVFNAVHSQHCARPRKRHAEADQPQTKAINPALRRCRLRPQGCRRTCSPRFLREADVASPAGEDAEADHTAGCIARKAD